MSTTIRDSWATFIFCFLVGGLILLDTLRYPEVQGQGFGQGPGFYPQLLAGILIFLGAMFLFQELKRKETDVLEANQKKPDLMYTPVILLNVFSLVLITLMKYLGFFVSGFLLIFSTALLIRWPVRKQHLWQDLTFSLGMIFLIYIVFEIFVGIELPRSVLIN